MLIIYGGFRNYWKRRNLLSAGAVKWFFMAKAVSTEEMEPTLSVVADIDISIRDYFQFIACRKIKSFVTTALVISPQKLWFLVACIIFGSQSIKGTSLVVLVAPNQIIIAADSNETVVRNGVKTITKTCKIRREGRTFYAVEGYYGIEGMKTDIFGIAKSAITKSTTVHGIYDIAEPVIFKLLPGILRMSKTSAPETYAEWLKGSPVTSLVFASFEKGVPAVVCIGFKVDTKGIPIHPKPVLLGGGDLDTGAMGFHEHIDVLLHSPSWQRRFFSVDAIAASQELIQSEIDASVEEKRADVGPPISIVRITAVSSGSVTGHEGVCPDHDGER